MLIGLSKKFIFIASLKTASTTIEEVLGKYAEICLVESPFGKHMTFATMEKRFSWLFEEVPLSKFFVFGVIRDPVEFALSLYNSHRADEFNDRPTLFTGNITFEEFRTVWVQCNQGQAQPQSNYFIDSSGENRANYVISYDHLVDGLNNVFHKLGLPPEQIPTSNKSPQGLTKDDLTQDDIQWCHQHYHKDYVFMDRYCNKII